MGFFTEMAKGFAKGYVSERGIQGTLEDAGEVIQRASKLGQKFFGNNGFDDEVDYEEESEYNCFSKEIWDELCSKVVEAKDEEDYDGALTILDSYYRRYEVERDYWYNYVKTDVLIAQYINCFDRPQTKDLALKAKIENVIMSCKGRSDEDKESTHELEDNFKQAQGLVEYRRSLLALNENIKDLRDPNHIVTTSKFNDALKALDMLSDFFSYNNPKMEDGTILDIDIYYYWRTEVFNSMFDALAQNRNELNSLSDKQLSDFFEDAIDSVQKALDYSESDDKSNEEFYCQKIPEQIEKIKQLRNRKSNTSSSSSDEQEYLEELKACLEDDGKITDKERRLLDRLRKSLGISEERAKELEASLNGLSDEEKEYQEELKACMEDGHISDKERRLLDRLRKSLGISEQRAKEIEDSL